MSRGQFAMVGAVCGAFAVAMFVIAFDLDGSAVSGGHLIRQHSIGLFMLAGAAVGFIAFGAVGGSSRREQPTPTERPPSPPSSPRDF